MAEGVRIYSQETWKQVTEDRGKQLVETYISNVVDYYIEATDADNHAVREAACACIAELGKKVEKMSSKNVTAECSVISGFEEIKVVEVV